MELDPNPLRSFEQWFEEAKSAGLPQPEAMTLATSSKGGNPEARMVLFKGLLGEGFTFYTNYRSRKGKTLTSNPRAALVFFWSPLGRQIRIEGKVKQLTPKQSDEYFATRPRDSQLGAWASPQSSQLKMRSELVKSLAEFERKFAGKSVPRPPHWGGYVVLPGRIEFWEGKPGRLHERTVYTKSGKGWKSMILAP